MSGRLHILPEFSIRRVAPHWPAIAIVLAALTVYWSITRNGFVELDTSIAILQNPRMTHGLSWANVIWAFTEATFYYDYWHPLTWLSHLLDMELYGLNPSGHHLTSLLLHLSNIGLLFILVSRATGSVRTAVISTGLFALHPVHVESVAWVVERKDLLSMFFGLLSTIAYLRFVTSRKLVWIVTAKQ